MSAPKLNKPAPKFTLPSTNGEDVSLSKLKGKNIVLYFYPKDATPGCTLESQDFRDNFKLFTNQNTVILGVSRDKMSSHEKFKDKHEFQFELLSDEEEEVCKLYDVIKLKNMYGKKVRGIERSTFLIDKSGTLRNEWRKVKVKGHVEEVLQAVEAL